MTVEMTPAWFPILVAFAVALAYGLIGLGSNMAANPNVGFSAKKFTITIILSMLVGVIMVVQQIEVSMNNVAAIFTMVAGQTGILYYLNKFVGILFKYFGWEEGPETPGTGGEITPTTT